MSIKMDIKKASETGTDVSLRITVILWYRRPLLLFTFRFILFCEKIKIMSKNILFASMPGKIIKDS